MEFCCIMVNHQNMMEVASNIGYEKITENCKLVHTIHWIILFVVLINILFILLGETDPVERYIQTVAEKIGPF